MINPYTADPGCWQKYVKSVLVTRALLSLCESLSATTSANNSIWAKLLYISFTFQHITIISILHVHKKPKCQ